MKTFFSPKTMLALAVAIAAAAGTISQAQDQPIPPPAGASVLPPEIEPNTPLAEVVKLAQSGVDLSVIKNYISNSTAAFNLDADKIITLKDVGVPTEVVNAMMDRDKALYLAAAVPPPVVSAPAVATTPTDTAPPTQPVTVNYFDTTLTPYGSWVVVEGYGRCWRPTTVIYDANWRPYCDRGHWVYTDCGWYWDSDYAWGVTFHYGRWFRHDHFGWCWYPDTEWAPSWVTWRSSSDYCGWAPLPPLAVYRPGVGFFYRGASVSVSFDFGLRADCFTFVSPDRFCEHHPRRFCVEPERVTRVYSHTTVINNFNVHDRFVVNNGIDASRFRDRDHHPIRPVQVGALPNAGRQGWRGGDGDHQGRRGFGDNNNIGNNATRNIGSSGGNNGQPNRGQGWRNDANGGQGDRGPVVHDARNNNGNDRQGGGAGGHQQNVNVNHDVGSPYVAPRQQTPENQGNHSWGNHDNNNNDGGNRNGSGGRNGQRDHSMSGGNAGQTSTQAAATGQPPGNPAGAGNNNNGAQTVRTTGAWNGRGNGNVLGATAGQAQGSTTVQAPGNNNAGNNAGGRDIRTTGGWSGNGANVSQGNNNNSPRDNAGGQGVRTGGVRNGAPAGSLVLSGPAPTPVTTPAIVTPPSTQNHSSMGGNNNNGGASSTSSPRVSGEIPQSQRQQQASEQFRQQMQRMNSAVVAVRDTPHEQWRNAQAQTPAVSAPITRPNPPVVTERVQPRVEVRQTHVENVQPVQRSAPPAAAPAQTQSQSRDSDRGANRGSGNNKKDQ